MKPSVEQVGSLLALRRDLRPEDGYWQEFLGEFHHRQRQQAVKKSGLLGTLDSFSTWISDLGPAKWAYSAGLAYASITAAFLLMPKEPATEGLPPAPIRHEVQLPAPQPLEQLEELDLGPAGKASVGEQAF